MSFFVLFCFQAKPYLFTTKRQFCQQHLQMTTFMISDLFWDSNRYFTIILFFKNLCRKLLLLTIRGYIDAGRGIIAVYVCWFVVPRKVSVGEGSDVSVEEVAFWTSSRGNS